MSKTLIINNIVLDIEIAIKRIKHDIRDDWFQDPFKYEDLLDVEYIFERIQDKLIKNENGLPINYAPGSDIHIDIPKPHFTSRYSIETDIVDRVFCQALIDFISEDLDKLHSAAIYSCRLNTTRSDEKYFFRYPVEEWKKFINDTYSELNGDYSILLLSDLTNFYENIGINDLKDVLETYKPPGEKGNRYITCINLIKTIYSKWATKNKGRGLPQNRDTSSFLANIFLHPIDDSMRKMGFKYFRYMDDIRIICRDKFEARKALKILIQELRKYGLNVNSKKTRILDCDNIEDKKDIEKNSPHPDKVIEQIEELLKTRDARAIQIAVPMLRKKIISLIDNNNTIEREFRYCINRLERIARNEKLAEKINFKLINERVLSELIDQPWVTDTFTRYLESVNLNSSEISVIKELLLDEKRNIYEWQSFYLWGLLVRYKYSDANLIKIARQNISTQINIPTTAASCLYLGANGDVEDKRFIAERFAAFNDHLTQRFALIAIKDLNYKTILEPNIKNRIINCYLGSLQKLTKKFNDQFLYTITPLKEEDIFTEIPYDIS